VAARSGGGSEVWRSGGSEFREAVARSGDGSEVWGWQRGMEEVARLEAVRSKFWRRQQALEEVPSVDRTESRAFSALCLCTRMSALTWSLLPHAKLVP
jgi:hypothetical protein